jgi:hypothetical protein
MASGECAAEGAGAGKRVGGALLVGVSEIDGDEVGVDAVFVGDMLPVGVTDGVAVTFAAGEPVGEVVSVALSDSVELRVGVFEGERVELVVGVSVLLSDSVELRVGVFECERVTLVVGVSVALSDSVELRVGVFECERVELVVGVSVLLAVSVSECVGVVLVVALPVGVAEAVTDGDALESC